MEELISVILKVSEYCNERRELDFNSWRSSIREKGPLHHTYDVRRPVSSVRLEIKGYGLM
jgi:hypothetical protein